MVLYIIWQDKIGMIKIETPSFLNKTMKNVISKRQGKMCWFSILQLFRLNYRNSIAELKKMQSLDVSKNFIKIIYTHNFYGLYDLRELRLDHNAIKV